MTRHPKRQVNSYDRDAPVPPAGSRWTWEPDKPWARQVITVTDVRWNGGEWWVQAVPDRMQARPFFQAWNWGPVTESKPYWNDLSRFWEAVEPL